MSKADGGRLTTHVLDTASGKPAAGLSIALYRIDGDARTHLKTVVTNADGRCDAPLLAGADFATGEYELVFAAGDYLRAQGRSCPSRLPRHRADPLRHGGGQALPRAAAGLALRLFDLPGELSMAKLKIRNEIRFILNGEDVALTDGRAGRDAARLSAAPPLAARHQGRLRRGRLRRLHRAGRPAVAAASWSMRASTPASASSARSTARHVVTVEHLRGEGGKLHPVQQAMVDFHGSQCGFCTPGFVMSLYALWMRSPEPSDAAIEKALQGNLCRCTGYEAIVRAAQRHFQLRQGGEGPAGGRAQGDRRRGSPAMNDGARVEIGEGKQRLIVPANRRRSRRACSTAEPSATIVAGSTDVGLWVTKFMRDISPAVFIGNLDGSADDLRGARASSPSAPASPTPRRSRRLPKRIPTLGPLIDRIGGEQVRNMGTIGGNIANGSPIGDTPPPLIALGATLTLRKGKERRTMPLEDFFIAYGKQDRQPGEFVEAVHVPVPAKGTHFAVYKITKRRDEDITAALGAFHLTLGAGRHGGVDPHRLWRHGGDAEAGRRLWRRR